MHTRRTARALILIAVLAPLVVEDHVGAQGPRPRACSQQALGPAVADVPSVTVQPRFRLNGRAFPGARAGVAAFTLWASEPTDAFAGPQLVLGETHLPGGTVRVVPGVYDVYYSWISGPDIPRNRFTRVLQRVNLDRDRQLTIDVPMILVGGLKQHNGSPFGYDGAAALSLRGLDWPGEVPLGAAQPEAFQVAVIPGRYAFEYDWQQGPAFPNNRHAVVRRLNLAARVDDLVLNVPSLVQSFEFLHNGAPFPAATIESGDLVLRRGDREEVFVGSSHELGSTISMIPGSYDVHWRHVAGANVPGNRDARFARGLVATGGHQVIDVPSLEVSGNYLVNGQPPPQSDIENARLSLIKRNTGDSVELGETRYGAYQKRVVPGVYDIVYEHLTGASIMPSNPRATLARRWDVEDSPLRDIDIPVGRFKGSFLLNGASFSFSLIESGEIYAVPVTAEDDPIPLGPTIYGGFDRLLLPGSYRAAYAYVAGNAVPRNIFTTFGPARRVRQGVETTAVLDVVAAPLEVSYLHNGALMPVGGVQNARVHLMRGRDYLRLYDSMLGPAPLMAMEGQFDLFYQYRGGPDLPQNAFMRFGCWSLTR